MALFNDSINRQDDNKSVNTPSADSDDAVLVQSAQDGNRDAFLVLYNRYLPKVYNRVKSRIPPQDAEDVTQEIFIAVVKSLPRFERRSKFNTWLYTIVNRQIADYHRRYYRSSEKHSISIDTPEGQSVSVGGEGIDDMILIQQALEQLKDDYQEVILLRFADGLPFAEVAKKMNRSLEATKSLYRRAIQAMTENIEQPK